MKVVLLHGSDAAEPPEDPVLGQIEAALVAGGHEVSRVPVAGDVDPVIDALQAAPARYRGTAVPRKTLENACSKTFAWWCGGARG